jgi:flavin-binding protein dodecin
LEEARETADRGIQGIRLAGQVISNRQMGRLAFFHWENQIQSKYHLQCKRLLPLKPLYPFKETKYLLLHSHQSMQKIKYSHTYNILEILKMAVVKIIELIGSSPKNWEDATKNALAEAALTIKNIKSLYVKSCKAKVENNKITEYRAVVKIAFVVQREK